MLRVTIEVSEPGRDFTRIDTLHITNMEQGQTTHARYRVRRIPFDREIEPTTVYVENFDRSRGALALVGEAVKVLDGKGAGLGNARGGDAQ